MALDDLIRLREAAVRLLEALTLTQRERELRPIVAELEPALAKAWKRQGALFLNSIEERRQRLLQKTALTEQGDYEEIPPEEWMEWWPLLAHAMAKTIHLFVLPMEQAAYEAYLSAGNRVIGDVGVDYTFNLRNPRAQAYIEKCGAEMITNIDETTRAEIKSILKNAIQNGWSYDKTAKAISDRFQEFAVGKPQEHIRSRAHLVATTELGNAYEEGNLEGARQLQERGMAMEKLWVNVGDERVSDGCLANSAVGWIPLDEAFPSGHMRPLRFPGCRCHCQYRRMKTGA